MVLSLEQIRSRRHDDTMCRLYYDQWFQACVRACQESLHEWETQSHPIVRNSVHAQLSPGYDRAVDEMWKARWIARQVEHIVISLQGGHTKLSQHPSKVDIPDNTSGYHEAQDLVQQNRRGDWTYAERMCIRDVVCRFVQLMPGTSVPPFVVSVDYHSSLINESLNNEIDFSGELICMGCKPFRPDWLMWNKSDDHPHSFAFPHIPKFNSELSRRLGMPRYDRRPSAAPTCDSPHLTSAPSLSGLTVS